MVDKDSFWTIKSPGEGLVRLPKMQRDERIKELIDLFPQHYEEFCDQTETTKIIRECLSQNDYPDFNTGNADLYKAFNWRFGTFAHIQEPLEKFFLEIF